MKGIGGSLRRVCLIAGQTFLEAVRQRCFLVPALLALGMFFTARFFETFDFGGGGAKFMTDVGSGAIVFFGSVLAIVVTAQLFLSEIENRTALSLLAKPVGRFEYLCGKFFGSAAVLMAFTSGLTLILGGLLVLHGVAGPDVLDLWAFGFLQWLRLCLLAAITLFVASYARTALFCILASFMVWAVCQLQSVVREVYLQDGGAVALMAWLVGVVFPDFQLFDLRGAGFPDSGAVPDFGAILRVAAYALAYVPVFLLLAHLNFRNREI